MENYLPIEYVNKFNVKSLIYFFIFCFFTIDHNERFKTETIFENHLSNFSLLTTLANLQHIVVLRLVTSN